MSNDMDLQNMTLHTSEGTAAASTDEQVHSDERRLETNTDTAPLETSEPVECERSTKRSTYRHWTPQKQRVLADILFQVNDHPRGFPQLAAFVNADISFLIYREFSYLRNRLLLDREIELAQLERDLMTQDDEHARTCPMALSTRNLEEVCDEASSQRSRLLMDMTYRKLKEYGQ